MIIKPKKGWQLVDFKELSEYRDLFYFLVARDIKVRYKQTVLGGLWAIIQPLFSMIVFTLFFGRLAKMPSDGIPYPIFNFSAMVAWTYFANAVTNSGNSLISNTNLIAYQNYFYGIGNIEYFKKFRLVRNNYKWDDYEIDHLKNNRYLIGHKI